MCGIVLIRLQLIIRDVWIPFFRLIKGMFWSLVIIILIQIRNKLPTKGVTIHSGNDLICFDLRYWLKAK